MTIASQSTTDVVHQMITATKFGQRADLSAAASILKDEFTVTRYPEALQINLQINSQKNDENQIAFLFASGVIVNWSHPTVQEYFQQRIDTLFTQPYQEPVTEELSYQWNTVFTLQDDLILTPHTPKVLLSISYAIARSVQLDYNEQQVGRTVQLFESLPSQLVAAGKTSMRGKRVRQLIGSILETQFAVNVAGIAEDKPDLFWDEPQLAHYYTQMAIYLELKDRWYVLSEKLQLLHTTLDILRDEVNTKQSHNLEWIIIWLIVAEIIMAFMIQ